MSFRIFESVVCLRYDSARRTEPAKHIEPQPPDTSFCFLRRYQTTTAGHQLLLPSQISYSMVNVKMLMIWGTLAVAAAQLPPTTLPTAPSGYAYVKAYDALNSLFNAYKYGGTFTVSDHLWS